MVAVDATFLSLLFHPDARPPLDPSTGNPVERARERIEQLVRDLDERSERIVVPTPALSEFLVLAGESGPEYLAEISSSPVFQVAAFDERAAVELAAQTIEARRMGSKRGAAPEGTTWAKVKFDHQIVAIARVNGATRLYSDDDGVSRLGQRCGLEVIRIWQLPLPPPTQMEIFRGDGSEHPDEQAGAEGSPPAKGGEGEDADS